MASERTVEGLIALCTLREQWMLYLINADSGRPRRRRKTRKPAGAERKRVSRKPLDSGFNAALAFRKNRTMSSFHGCPKCPRGSENSERWQGKRSHLQDKASDHLKGLKPDHRMRNAQPVILTSPASSGTRLPLQPQERNQDQVAHVNFFLFLDPSKPRLDPFLLRLGRVLHPQVRQLLRLPLDRLLRHLHRRLRMIALALQRFRYFVRCTGTNALSSSTLMAERQKICSQWKAVSVSSFPKGLLFS